MRKNIILWILEIALGVLGSIAVLNITVRRSRQSGVARATCPD